MGIHLLSQIPQDLVTVNPNKSSNMYKIDTNSFRLGKDFFPYSSKYNWSMKSIFLLICIYIIRMHTDPYIIMSYIRTLIGSMDFCTEPVLKIFGKCSYIIGTF